MKVATTLLKLITFFDPRKLDNQGALLLPIALKIKDEEYKHYRQLHGNWKIKEVTPDDLPKDFSNKAVKLVDTFRKKTIDLPYEIMLFFDYTTGEIIYCFVNDEIDDNNEVKVSGKIDEDVFEGKHIASIHNHPFKFTAPPSFENFQILELKFEDYEIICGWEELWIIESKDLLIKKDISNMRKEINNLYRIAYNISPKNNFKKINERYGEFLLNYFSKIKNINLTRRVFK